MRVLLDTHALLWALVSPARLGRRARQIIGDSANTRVVSAASAWEISTKYRLGKLTGAGEVVREYARHLVVLVAEELAVTSQHALSAGLWETPHRDPFDRLLAAQCVIEGLPLVTNDRAMGQFAITLLW